MSFRRAPRTEERTAVVYAEDGTRTLTMTAAFIDRKQKIARRAAEAKRLERRERYAERHEVKA